MASSGSNQRRRAQQKKQPLTRSNSSFLGTLKSIVTAPLAWFSGNDEFEDAKDSKGKRRRLVAAPTEPPKEDDERTSRNKRMRVDSPPRESERFQLSYSRSQGYLDPPTHVFKRQPTKEQHAPPVPRSASVSLPVPTISEAQYNINNTTNAGRSALSPLRNLGISRTMSVDPPTRLLKRESAMAYIPSYHDVSMESITNSMRPLQRDLSVPPMPLSTRPSFRMRNSLTPISHSLGQRESSEPPPLTALANNPVFVRAPSSQPVELQQPSGIIQTTTLGSLADSARTSRSPIRQHSSLLFNTEQYVSAHAQRQQSPAERALHELDIYKTPLLPSRLRSSNDSAQSAEVLATSAIPDLFKSRRKQKLVLMHDDKRPIRLGTKGTDAGKTPVANNTKPYAGEGGMKKLLARRKLEAVADEGIVKSSQDRQVFDVTADEAMEDDRASKPETNGVDSAATLPLVTDRFAAAPINLHISGTGSSLRVGRVKTRNHIARPMAKLSRSKFSAAFEDDGDDIMDEGAVETEKEKDREREDTTSRAPIFSAPPGFSFAKELPQPVQSSSEGKEPPIPSLPFSLSKPIAQFKLRDMSLDISGSSATFPSIPTKNDGSISISVPQPKGTEDKPTDTKYAAGEDKGVPNFFASSKAFSKPLDISPVPPLTFGTTPPPSTKESSLLVPPIATCLAGADKFDSSNTIKVKHNEAFFAPSATSVSQLSSRGVAIPPISMDSTSLIPSGVDSAMKTAPDSENKMTAITNNLTSFNGLITPAAVTTRTEATEAASSINARLSIGASITETSLPSKAGTLSVVIGGETSKDASTSGEPISTTRLAPNDVQQEGSFDNSINKSSTISNSETSNPPPASSPFSFALPAAPATELVRSPFESPNPSGDAPKPLFGGFMFGQASSTASKSEASAPTSLTFGATTSSTSREEKKPVSTFAFGTSQVQAQTSAGVNLFSFGGGGTVACDVSKPFSFGAPSSAAPPDCPVTPPKVEDQEVRMDESPTRDMQPSSDKVAESRATSSFAFGPSPTSTLFRSQANGDVASTSPFVFSVSRSTSSNSFATSIKESKPVESKSIGFSQTTTPSTSTFSFNQNKAPEAVDAARSSTSPFSFGGNASAFTFGSQTSQSSNNVFGTNSAPSSPAIFATPFSFGAPASSTTTFTFGSSQPASPVGGSNLALPQPATPGGFGSTAVTFGQSAPSSPFSAPSPLTPSTSSGPLFTIGSAPTPTPGAPRQIKKLPTRRGGAKR
ncbi:hypothetical protein AX17_003292 [Amanita inopinata Kibby_2008]|nr:hypothetical protein AX17_003292 [Amanita inopinata Kibby_2008]